MSDKQNASKNSTSANSTQTSDFKPYIPANQSPSELTVTSVITGIILAVVFGAANAYLGLRVGMTISASIPAAVIAMGVTRIVLKRNSILESNMVQTIGSAGESIAGGVIFTVPVLFLWAKEGLIPKPSLLTVSLISAAGGILGVLLMIPLRKSIIVKEHGKVPFPEAQACTEVLLAGEKKEKGSNSIFVGMGFAAVIKFIIDGFKLAVDSITIPFKSLKTMFSVQIYPAVIAVGYICGFKISAFLIAGSLLAWFVLIPMISIFGANTILFPATVTISELLETAGPIALWSNYIRYIGAGALATAGIISLIKNLPLICKTFSGAISGLKNSTSEKTAERTNIDLSIKFVLCGIFITLISVWLLPPVQAGIVSIILILILGFVFSTVTSKLVGVVGASNNPISGMAIATILMSATLLKLCGDKGVHGMVSIITIAAIITIISALAGDMSQDLKTGYNLGATPKKQQIGELIGATVASVTIGGILVLLDNAWGFGSQTLSAPQATLLKLITEGVMNGNLPWSLILLGVALALIFEFLGLPSLTIAIGIYLPLELNASIFFGGLLKYIVDKKKKSKSSESSNGVLFSSGLIAGEGLVGILLAVLTVCGAADKIAFGNQLPDIVKLIFGIVILACIAFAILRSSFKREN